MVEKKSKYIGTSPSYENAANKTDVPRYSDEEKKDYGRFGQTPEPEDASNYYQEPKEEKAEEKPAAEQTEKPAAATPVTPAR